MNTLSRKEKERLERKKDIINAAEKIFTEMGYGGASMEEIAKEAEFTRKTVYQYFSDKEDLFFAVITRGFSELLLYCQEGIEKGNTGFEKLHNLASAYYRFYLDHSGTLELMNYVGYIKSNKENTNSYEEFNSISNLLVQEVSKIINEGKKDGSIRTDVDTLSLTYSAEFLISGLFHMFSISGKTFTNHFSINEKDFLTFSTNLLCDAFRGK